MANLPSVLLLMLTVKASKQLAAETHAAAALFGNMVPQKFDLVHRYGTCLWFGSHQVNKMASFDVNVEQKGYRPFMLNMGRRGYFPFGMTRAMVGEFDFDRVWKMDTCGFCGSGPQDVSGRCVLCPMAWCATHGDANGQVCVDCGQEQSKEFSDFAGDVRAKPK